MKKELVYQLICGFMRIGLLPLLLVSCFAGVMYARPVNGQDILNRKINLVADQKEIKVILNEISKLADIKFVYSAQRIPVRQKVSVTARDKRVAEVLDFLLQPLDILYYVSGDQIVLFRKNSPWSQVDNVNTDSFVSATSENYTAKNITGKVTNENGEPLAGVSILVKGTSRGTSTNENGAFSISADVGE